MVKWRRKHIGTPDNRLKTPCRKKNIPRPRGEDMIPEFGPVVIVSSPASYHIFAFSAT
jgi:hypothetical protein